MLAATEQGKALVAPLPIVLLAPWMSSLFPPIFTGEFLVLLCLASKTSLFKCKYVDNLLLVDLSAAFFVAFCLILC